MPSYITKPAIFSVSIADIGTDGFIDNVPPRLYQPKPTTDAAGLLKAKGHFRWMQMMTLLGHNAVPKVFDVVKAGEDLNDNPPDTIAFKVQYDRYEDVRTHDESGDFDGIKVAYPAVAGSEYVVGEILTVSGGTGTAAKLIVTEVDSSGGVVAVDVYDPGSYTANPSSPVSVTGGSGNSATFNVTFVDNPGLWGLRAVKRLCTRAMRIAVSNWNWERYTPQLLGNEQQILDTTISALGSSLLNAEANVTVTHTI